MAELDRMMKKVEVAELLGICVRGVERLIARGDLAKHRIGKGAVRVPVSSVELYQESVRAEVKR